MIDNVVLLMIGALQSKSVKEILGKCHPLGRFTEMEAVNVAETPSDLFSAVLVETPLGRERPGHPACAVAVAGTCPSKHSPPQGSLPSGDCWGWKGAKDTPRLALLSRIKTNETACQGPLQAAATQTELRLSPTSTPLPSAPAPSTATIELVTFLAGLFLFCFVFRISTFFSFKRLST